MATQTEIIEIKFKGEEAKKGLTDLNNEVEKLKQSFTSADVKAAGGLSSFKKELTETKEEAKQTTEAVKKTTKANKNFAVESVETNKIIATTDRLTGGMATAFIDLYQGLLQSGKAAKVFIGGLSGIKKALIATALGAFVVALGLVVAYWEDIVALFDDGSKKLQQQVDLNKENLKISEQQLISLTNQEKILGLQGKSTVNIVKEKRKLLLILQEENTLLLNNLKVQLESEKAQIKEITFYEKLKIVASEALGGIGLAGIQRAKALSGTEEELLRLKEIEEEIQKTKINGEKLEIRLLQLDKQGSDLRTKEISDNEKLQEDADKRLQNLKDRIREAEANKQDEARALELQKIKEHNEALMVEALANGLLSQELVNSLNETFQAKKDEFALQDAEKKAAIKASKDEADLKESARKQSIADQDRALEKQKIKNKLMVLNAISQFADAESGIGKSLLIVKQGLALKETIMDLKRITFKGIEAVGSAGVSTAQNVAESSKIGFPQNIITIAGAIAQGVGIIRSVKKAVSKTKASASASASASVPSISSPSAPAAAPQSPVFNIVGASQTSQLANVINAQEKQPLQAYVVSQDITTSQSLNRAIKDTATIG